MLKKNQPPSRRKPVKTTYAIGETNIERMSRHAIARALRIHSLRLARLATDVLQVLFLERALGGERRDLAFERYAAFVDDDDLLTDLGDFGQNVRRQDHCALVRQRADELAD